MRIGIFGGTFNPPHKGHAEALRCFISSARLDKVLIIPTYVPPHKETGADWVDFDTRLEMCRIAFESVLGNFPSEFSDIEKRLSGESGEKNYTWKTVEALLKTEDTLCLYVGTDMFLTLDKWKNSEYLFANTEIWAMPRGNPHDVEIPEFKKTLEQRFPSARINLITTPPTDASSTEVRAGDFGLISRRMREYIIEKGLYQ